jgi:tetratricopeptide (TPR) repeat protein
MGSYYFLKKDYPNAKLWNKKLFDLDPSNKELQIKALQTLALIAQKEKNYVEARDYYIDLRKLDPANPEYTRMIKEFTKTIDAIEIQKANAKILN